MDLVDLGKDIGIDALWICALDLVGCALDLHFGLNQRIDNGAQSPGPHGGPPWCRLAMAAGMECGKLEAADKEVCE